MGDSDLERLRRRYQPENFGGEVASWRDWSRVFRTWAGRFQRGRVQEVIRTVEARPSDEAILSELDIKFARLGRCTEKRLRLTFYHALILFCKGKALKVVLTNKEGEGLEAWRSLVNKYEPPSKASVVGKLVEILLNPLMGDLLGAITIFERRVMIYEAQRHETIQRFLWKLVASLPVGMAQSSMREHLLFSASKCDSWANFYPGS